MKTTESYFSYHIFYFPFKWEIENMQNENLSAQIKLSGIFFSPSNNWERITECFEEEAANLYNEKNYYYQFVHELLYDKKEEDGLIYHYERKETKDSNRDIRYFIKMKGRKEPYSLRVEAINLNFYATGVGFLSFYLGNDQKEQSTPEDILLINQYGRRIMPPFFADVAYRKEIAEFIEIVGLENRNYKEDFNYTLSDTWKPASFITDLIKEVASNVRVEPVIDDRMFVASWYVNNDLCQKFNGNLETFMNEDPSNFWYRFLFVDGADCTCQNRKMKHELLQKHTYARWEEWSSLYGATRYSLVYLTNNGAPDFLFTYFETIYARMVELVLMQRASMLRFSAEVTKVSHLSNKEIEVISGHISSLYKEYIHFVNQVYFREVTAQDQGIELYKILQDSLKMEEYIKDLDGEIGELHQYVSLIDDRDRNKKATLLNNLATFFLPFSVITGFWGMNKVCDLFDWQNNWGLQFLTLAVGALVALCFVYKKKRKL